MTTTSPSKGIFDSANLEARERVVELLTEAYWMEMETVMSYIAASVNLDGVRAQEIKESLAEDVDRGAEPRAAIRRADQGALRRRPRQRGLQAGPVLPAAAR